MLPARKPFTTRSLSLPETQSAGSTGTLTVKSRPKLWLMAQTETDKPDIIEERVLQAITFLWNLTMYNLCSSITIRAPVCNIGFYRLAPSSIYTYQQRAAYLLRTASKIPLLSFICADYCLYKIFRF